MRMRWPGKPMRTTMKVVVRCSLLYFFRNDSGCQGGSPVWQADIVSAAGDRQTVVATRTFSLSLQSTKLRSSPT